MIVLDEARFNSIGIPPTFRPFGSSHQIARIVIESLYALSYKRRKDRGFFVPGNFSVNAGRKDDADIVRGGAVGDQPPDDKIGDLSASCLPCRIGHDDQNTFGGVHNVLEGGRIYWIVELVSDLDVGKHRLPNALAEHFKAFYIIFKRNDRLAVF